MKKYWLMAALVLCGFSGCRDKADPGLEPEAVGALLSESDAAICIRVEETRVLDRIGDVDGYFVNAVFGEVVQVFKGEMGAGEKMMYVNFIESGPRFPQPGERIVFLHLGADSTGIGKQWQALENADFDYSRNLKKAILKTLKKEKG
jgi:hypothetical protein